MSNRIALISLGCAKNLVDSEQMMHLLRESGFELTGSPDGADAVIINTCGFIDSAKSEAIETILEMAELKAAGQLKKIIVAGCLAERYREEIIREIPEVDSLLGVGRIRDIADVIKSSLAGKSSILFGDKNAPVTETDRIISTAPGWAYIKIAEGCDNRCAYCAIPDIRGRFRSRPMENIIAEAMSLAKSGIRELIVVAQDITRYGSDLYGKRNLHSLIRKLCEIEGIDWIRLHYMYPDEIDDELIDVISAEDKVVKYLDIPIQHINDSILKRMNRRGTGADIRALFKKLRESIPGLVLRTSLITGLPGEGEDEFEELCDFLHEAKIERAGVFPYSPEENTPAAGMSDRCEEETAIYRADIVMRLQSDIMDEFNNSRLGKTLTVLCQGFDTEAGLFWGRSYADSPDIDGKVFFKGPAVPGEFISVSIHAASDGDLIGDTI